MGFFNTIKEGDTFTVVSDGILAFIVILVKYYYSQILKI
jgi:hypothetical protein